MTAAEVTAAAGLEGVEAANVATGTGVEVDEVEEEDVLLGQLALASAGAVHGIISM